MCGRATNSSSARTPREVRHSRSKCPPTGTTSNVGYFAPACERGVEAQAGAFFHLQFLEARGLARVPGRSRSLSGFISGATKPVSGRALKTPAAASCELLAGVRT